MKRGSTYKKTGPYKRTRYSKGTARNPIVIPDTQVRRIMNARTGGYIGMEKKFYDSYRAAQFISAAGNMSGGEVDPAELCLNCPAQNDTETGRDGRQIRMDSITIKGTILLEGNVAGSYTYAIPEIFIALVVDKQTNGAQIQSEQVFDNNSATSTLTTSGFRNLENVNRVNILKTVRIAPKDFNFNTVASGVGYLGTSTPFTMFHDLKGMQVNFNTGISTSSVGAIADRSLHMIAYCSSPDLTPKITYNARLRFRG